MSTIGPMVTVITIASLIILLLLGYAIWRQRQQSQKIAEITQALDEISTATAAVAAETRATRLLQLAAEHPPEQQRRRRPDYLRPLAVVGATGAAVLAFTRERPGATALVAMAAGLAGLLLLVPTMIGPDGPSPPIAQPPPSPTDFPAPERTAPTARPPERAPGSTDRTDGTGETVEPVEQQDGAASPPSPSAPTGTTSRQRGEPEPSPSRPPGDPPEEDPPDEDESRPTPTCSVAYVAADVPAPVIGPIESETCLGAR